MAKHVTSGSKNKTVDYADWFEVPLPSDGKNLFKGRHLQFEGGFRIPELSALGSSTMKYSTLSIDKIDGTTKWVTSRPGKFIIELDEPVSFGTGSVSTWPLMTLGRYQEGLFPLEDKYSPAGVFYLDADNVLFSSRKSYRSGFADDWIGQVNMNTGVATYYTPKDPSNDEDANFHILQAAGAGFCRVYDADLKTNLSDGNDWLLGCGGYDVLGSPLGPALASWSINDATVDFVMDFPSSTPARRDSYYLYPSLDPATYDKVQLPIWKDPDITDGFWQAGKVFQTAIINHPTIKGVVSTAFQSRGVLDYRAQGDDGSGENFLVSDPSTFYTENGSPDNRGGHQQETANSAYANGGYARVLYVTDPAELQAVKDGTKQPWEVSHQRYEFPQDNISSWSEDNKKPTEIRGVFWDDDRQLLFFAMNWDTPVLVAYSLVDDDSRPEAPVVIPTGFGW